MDLKTTVEITWKNNTSEGDIDEITDSIISLLDGFNFRLDLIEKVVINHD